MGSHTEDVAVRLSKVKDLLKHDLKADEKLCLEFGLTMLSGMSDEDKAVYLVTNPDRFDSLRAWFGCEDTRLSLQHLVGQKLPAALDEATFLTAAGWAVLCVDAIPNQQLKVLLRDYAKMKADV